MLDGGKLLTPGELGLVRTLEREKSKHDDSDAPLLCFSPDIRQATSTATGRVNSEGGSSGGAARFVDRRTGRAYSARTAFMLEVEPGSYKVKYIVCDSTYFTTRILLLLFL